MSQAQTISQALNSGEAQTVDYRRGPGVAGNDDADPIRAGLPLSAWIKIGSIAVLFCFVFWPNLRRLWEKTNPFYGEANWGHACAVPIIGLYYLYVHRDQLRAGKVKPA